ncbi:hypothetical protein EUTSA_v10008003mg [Eutrema salsugineum]|uniref:F-box domain-containing protein n=1 Tax=Eutrema salsugineum TaxID=72664 RepID=V4L3L1_EUTSA|nr:hypothetical protein EUTSA_v10008003mg [Eutrema salsugineum]
MEEILTRLPAKSLMRFKCVSKLWSSLISSRYFSNRFHTVPSQPRPRLYMCVQDFIDYRNTIILSLAPDTSASPSSCFVVDHNLTIPRMGGYILQNLRGFMCYTFLRKPRIYNPATRQLVTLPAAIKSNNIIPSPGENTKIVSYYFGHDPVMDQYKVVCSTGVYLRHLRVIRSKHRVFALKAGRGGSWRKAAPTPAEFLPHIPVKGGVCIDGIIYYMGWTGRYSSALVSFHIRSGDFKMIHLPRRDGDELPRRFKNVSLIEYGGKVTIIDQTNLQEKGMLDLWAVEDSRDNKWSRKTLNGKVFFIPEDLFSPFHILCYDLQSNDMRKIEIKGVPDHWFSKDKSTVNVMLMDQSESLMHVLGDLN